MFITKKHLSRRTFLRGVAGATMVLPILDAMVPALTAQSKTAAAPQFRFGAIYFPQGSVSLPSAPKEMWHPTGTGANFEFTEVLKPFEPFRDQVTLLSGLSPGQQTQLVRLLRVLLGDLTVRFGLDDRPSS